MELVKGIDLMQRFFDNKLNDEDRIHLLIIDGKSIDGQYYKLDGNQIVNDCYDNITDMYELRSILEAEFEITKENKNIDKLIFYKLEDNKIKGLQKSLNISLKEMADKINELTESYNKLTKEREER